MIEARFEYKCRKCGELTYNPCCHPDLARQIFFEILTCGKGHDKGGSYVESVGFHSCGSGDMGLTDLQGYKIVDTMAEGECDE